MQRGGKHLKTGGIAVLIALLGVGCAAQRAYRVADKSAQGKYWDDAVVSYSKALNLKPGSTRYRLALARAKLRAGQQHFEKGKRLLNAGQLESAIAEIQQTVLLDPGNQYAVNELQRAVALYEQRRDAPPDLDTLKEKVRREGTDVPKLHPGSNIPIVLKFKDEPIGKIYDALSKAAGINFLFDERVKLDKKVTIEVSDVTFEKALDILMLQNKHFYTVWDENTLILADDNRQKRQEYDDLVIKTFYLSNAKVKDIQTLLRTLLDARQVVQNEDLNAITIRDTPARVAVAGEIIKLNDKAKAELIIDITLLELNRNILRTLGIDLTTKSLGITFNGGENGLPLNNLDLLKQRGSWVVSPIPGILLNFLRTDADAQIIAKPQLRVSEGEKASVRIGDRIPIPTTTFNTGGTVGGNIIPVTSFTYQNVGINIDIEPRVHHNKEISLKLRIEVSSLSGTVQGSGGISQPIIGTREIETTIRLKDGATTLLAGLIREEERTSLSSVPWLGAIPGLKRLFGNNDLQIQQTDIIMTLTPHIVRIADIREEDLRALWIGTESNIRLRGAKSSAFGHTPFEDQGLEIYPPAPVEETEEVTTGGEILEEAGPDEDKPAGSGEERQGIAGSAGAPLQGETGQAGEEAGEGDTDSDPASGGRLEPPESGAEEVEEPEPPKTPARVVLTCGPAGAGSNYRILVRLFNGTSVQSVPYHLKFDPNILQFVGATEGPYLGRGAVQTQFLHSISTSDPGEVFFGQSRLDQKKGVSGGGVLAWVDFLALKPAETEIQFTDEAVLGANNTPMPASFHGCRVVVK